VALFIAAGAGHERRLPVWHAKGAWASGWRDAARPLLVDYVDRLAAEIGSPPSVERAQAITQRLPVTVRISGPQVNWRSTPMTTSNIATAATGGWTTRPTLATSGC
jgi:hypothetical protein